MSKIVTVMSTIPKKNLGWKKWSDSRENASEANMRVSTFKACKKWLIFGHFPLILIPNIGRTDNELLDYTNVGLEYAMYTWEKKHFF